VKAARLLPDQPARFGPGRPRGGPKVVPRVSRGSPVALAGAALLKSQF